MDLSKMAGWVRSTPQGEWQSEKQATQALHNSTLFGLFLRGSDEQIGFASVVSDHNAFSAITNVFIADGYRRIGMGRMLMKTVVAHPSVARTICVLQTRVPQFYAHFGFEAMLAAGPEACWMQRNPTKK